MSEKEMQKQIKELSNMRSKVLDLISKYNRLATKIDFESRLGMVEADMDRDDISQDYETINDYIKSTYDYPYTRIITPDADAWFPSAICSGY